MKHFPIDELRNRHRGTGLDALIATVAKAGTLDTVNVVNNVELKRDQEDPQAEARRERRERLLALVERAAAYYERVLWQSPEAARAREYLTGRGLGEEVLRKFRVAIPARP